MKTIKFICHDSLLKQFAAAVRMNVNEYFKENRISIKDSLFLIIQIVTMLSVCIIPFVLIFIVLIVAWMAILMAASDALQYFSIRTKSK